MRKPFAKRYLLLLVLLFSLSLGSVNTVQAATKCHQGGTYGYKIDLKGIHHYVNFDLSSYKDVKKGNNFRISPNTFTLTVLIKIGNKTISKTMSFGTSPWGWVSANNSNYQFGINGDGIVQIVGGYPAKNFTICWNQ